MELDKVLLIVNILTIINDNLAEIFTKGNDSISIVGCRKKLDEVITFLNIQAKEIEQQQKIQNESVDNDTVEITIPIKDIKEE